MGNVEEESFYEHTDMPEELYVDYLETLRIFLPQHPFLQNLIKEDGIAFTGPAFRDFTLAYILANREYEDLALDYFGDRSLSSHFPSQLLFDFYVEFSELRMSGKIFPLLYDSYKAKETAAKIAIIDISGDKDGKYVLFRIRDLSKKINEKNIELQMEENSAIYISRIANANIDVDGEVYIGDLKNTTRIYNSSIICDKIVFQKIGRAHV